MSERRIENIFPPQNQLHFKIATFLAVGSFLVAIISSWTSFKHSFNQELIRGEQFAEQLIDIVNQTAAIAAYLNEEELGQQLVNGLVGNSLIASATLTVSNGKTITAFSTPPSDKEDQNNSSHVIRLLKSPFSGTNVGKLLLIPNRSSVVGRAKTFGITNAISLGVQTLIVTFLCMMLIYWHLTKPIKAVARELHNIHPGEDKRIIIQDGHRSDEIGSLISDINRLLGLTQNVITEERNVRKQMESLEIKYQKIFDHSHAAFFVINHKGHLLEKNKSFENLFFFAFSGAKRQQEPLTIFDFFMDQEKLHSLGAKSNPVNQVIEYDLQVKVPQNQPVMWVHCVFTINTQEGKPIIEGVAFDISERILNEQVVSYQAEHDQLTGLLNRHGAELALQSLLQEAQQSTQKPVIFLLDLDEFKIINDQYGHDSGDMVLVEVARRLSANRRGADKVIRWGGDEFMIIGSDIDNDAGIEHLAALLIHVIKQPIKLKNNQTGTIGVSIGIAQYESSVNGVQELIKYADQAMYMVKKKKKNNYHIYNPALDAT